MKVTRTEAGVTLRFGKREATLFWSLLQNYPCIPPGHFPASRINPLEKEEEVSELLNETLAMRRAEIGHQFQRILSDPSKHRQLSKSTELELSHEETETLLQVLNDIRVGSWLQLGSPESLDFARELPDDQAPHAWRMDLAGYFQAQLLGDRGSL